MRKRIKELPDKSNIFNMDETPFILKQSQRLLKIETKSVNVKAHGGEHLRITVMFAIGANGIKLSPLVVFKGKKDEVKEEKLHK